MEISFFHSSINWGTYEAEVPTNIKDVRHFLRLTGYYQKFICNYTDIVHPLNCLPHTLQPLIWTLECQANCDMLCSWLANTPIVQLPNPNKSCLLFTDVRKLCYLGVITQVSTEDSNKALLRILTSEDLLESMESQTPGPLTWIQHHSCCSLHFRQFQSEPT